MKTAVNGREYVPSMQHSRLQQELLPVLPGHRSHNRNSSWLVEVVVPGRNEGGRRPSNTT